MRERRIPLELAKAAVAAAGADVECAQVASVPGQRDLLLVVGLLPPVSDTDYGKCFILVRQSRGRLERVARGHGGADSYSFDPIFFTGAGRIFVAAEMGTEFPWGYAIFEIVRGRQLVELGSLDIFLDDPEAENGRSATDVLRAVLEHGQLVIEVDAPAVWESIGSDGSTEHARRGRRPVAFAQKGNKFERVR